MAPKTGRAEEAQNAAGLKKLPLATGNGIHLTVTGEPT